MEWNEIEVKSYRLFDKFDNLQFFCDYLFNQLIPIERLKHKYSMFFFESIKGNYLSSIGDDIDWKLLIRQLFDAIDNSPSVIEPKAESWDGLQLLLVLHVCVPRIEYSIRRLFEFFDVPHESVVNWFENVGIDVTAADEVGMARFSFVLSFDAFGDEVVAPIFDDVDGIDSFDSILLSKNVIGDDMDGCKKPRNWWYSDDEAVMTTSSKTSSKSLEISNEFTSRNLSFVMKSEKLFKFCVQR